jgi:hypothetical protein
MLRRPLGIDALHRPVNRQSAIEPDKRDLRLRIRG